MKQRHVFAAVAVIFILACPCWGAAPVFVVSGTVVGYDEKTITLKQEEGVLVKVPRKAIANIKEIKVGVDLVDIQVLPEDLLALNPSLREAAAAASKKKKK